MGIFGLAAVAAAALQDRTNSKMVVLIARSLWSFSRISYGGGIVFGPTDMVTQFIVEIPDLIASDQGFVVLPAERRMCV